MNEMEQDGDPSPFNFVAIEVYDLSGQHAKGVVIGKGVKEDGFSIRLRTLAIDHRKAVLLLLAHIFSGEFSETYVLAVGAVADPAPRQQRNQRHYRQEPQSIVGYHSGHHSESARPASSLPTRSAIAPLSPHCLARAMKG